MSTLISLTDRMLGYPGFAARCKALLHTLLQEVAVPLFGICCFLMVWSLAARHIQTSLGTFPGPAAVMEQAQNLVVEYKEEKQKAADFYTRQAERTAEKLAAELARKQEIQAQLETYKRQISDAVYAGTVFKSVKLPKKWTLYSNDAQSIAHPNHPDNHLWVDFEEWARGEDLDVDCEYAHDGMGMESWYNLTVKPL